MLQINISLLQRMVLHDRAWSMQHDVPSFPLSAEQISQAPALGETLSRCQHSALPNRNAYIFLLLFLLLLLFAFHLPPGSKVGSALLFMGLDTSTQYYAIAEVGRSFWRLLSPAHWTRMFRAMSNQVLNISRDGDSKRILGKLFQCSTTLTATKSFPLFKQNFLYFSLCPLPLDLSLGITVKVLASPSSSPSGLYMH